LENIFAIFIVYVVATAGFLLATDRLPAVIVG
jgi:hypothetical protein